MAVAAGVLAGLAAAHPPGWAGLRRGVSVGRLPGQGRALQRAVRAAGCSVGAALVPLGVYLACRLAFFGDWLPNTARAKRQGLPSATDLLRPGALVTYAGWLGVLLAVGAIVLVLGHRSRTRTAIGVLLVPLVLALAAFSALPPDWMAQYRFATPVWPLGAIVVVLAVVDVWRRLGRRARVLTGVAGALAVLVTATIWVDAAGTFRRDPTAPLCFVATSVGQRVNAYADILRVRDGTLLAVDGGGTALTSRLRFVDLSGLTDAPIADLWQRGDARALRDHAFDVVRPTFFKIDSGWAEAEWTGLLADPRLSRDYLVVAAPGPGTGTFVRRDAVPDAASLAAARRYAGQALNGTDLPLPPRGPHRLALRPRPEATADRVTRCLITRHTASAPRSPPTAQRGTTSSMELTLWSRHLGGVTPNG